MTENSLLRLIKSSGAVRKFKDLTVPDEIIEQIVESGIWGLSILGNQPGYFVVIKNKKKIEEIADVTFQEYQDRESGPNMVLKVTARILRNVNLLIGVYNNRKMQSRVAKYGEYYSKRAHIAEIQTIGGAIQNMYLMTNGLGLRCIWLDAPTFCGSKVNKILGVDKELIAFLAIGFSDEKNIKRSKRDRDEMVEYLR